MLYKLSLSEVFIFESKKSTMYRYRYYDKKMKNAQLNNIESEYTQSGGPGVGKQKRRGNDQFEEEAIEITIIIVWEQVTKQRDI